MLELKKLTMTDFGIIKGTKIIEYDKGLNIISANNGKGKSTSIFAIEMLLIDNYVSSYENYINNNSDGFFISLDFLLDNQSYTISLDCKKPKNTMTSIRILSDSTGEIATGDEAKRVLAEMINPDITKYALVSKQKAIDNITTCTDSERRELFKRIKNLDYEKEINEKIIPKINGVKEDIIQKDKEIYAIENYPTQEPKTIKDLPFTEKELDSKKTELGKLNAEKSLADEMYKQRQEKEKRLNDLESNFNLTVSKISGKENIEKSTLMEITSLRLDLESIDKNFLITESESHNNYINRLEFLKESSKRNKLDLEHQKENIEKDITKLQKEVSEIKLVKLIPFNENKLTEIKSEISTIKANISTCKSNIKSLEKGVCPICGQECEHKLNEYQNELKVLENNLQEKLGIEGILITEKTDIQEKTDKNRTLKDTKTDIQNKIEKLESDLSYKITLLSNEDNELKKQLESEEMTFNKDKENNLKLMNETKSNKNQLIEIKESQIENLKKDIIDLESELESNTKERDLLGKELEKEILPIALNPINDLEQEIKSYNDTIIYNENVVTFNKELENTILENTKKLRVLKEEKSKLVKEQFDLEGARNIMLKDFPNYVIDSSIETVEESMNQFIEDVYYKPLDIALRSTKTSIKLEYGNGKRSLSASRLSGAEGKITDIAFINNFNKLLNLECLILDEPDGPLADNIKETFYETLLGMSSLYNQIIIITHSEKMCNYMISNNEVNLISL